MSNLKVEGKVGDFCLNCKNCKAVTRIHDGKNASIRIIKVDCEDPYDGMVKTLDADSNVCCSMFEPKPPCEKSERFDRTYCHGPNGTITISYKAVFGEPVNCPSYEEKKEKEPCDKISCLQHELEMDKLRMKIHELEKEKSDHLKGIERLKKRAADSDYYKEKSELLEEKLKKANKLADSWKKDYERIRELFLCPIYNILYPDSPNLDINVTDLLADVKNLKIYADENEKMYKELQEWREKCIARGKDVDHLLSENKEKDKKINELESSCTEKHAEISKLQNIVTEKEVELKKRLKENIYLSQNKFFADTVIEKNKKLNKTISDQEITIKALLITIKEMCKEENENA